ncbi:MAG: hypothetical protein LBH58_12490 [Tannerellaceae bacterium]|jgi:hypothetical protein|nr:hypothetical protein [Tannerellaceae bacterium]
MRDKERDDIFKRFQESFGNLEGHFHVLEQRVPIEIQMEYFKYSERMRHDNAEMSDEDFELYKQSLFDEQATVERKKHVLSALAVSHEVRAYRLLEEYARCPDPDATDWAHMAFTESRLSLESDLSDEKQIYISTGLGGKGEKLRFYTLFFASENKPFEIYQRQVIEREFAYYLPKESCEIERLTINDLYAELLFLIPVRKEIKAILDNVISECNQYGNFLSDAFTMTNVKELSPEDIAVIIKRRYENDKAGH